MSKSKEQQTDAAEFRELVEEKQKRYKATAGFGSKENHESAEHTQRQHFTASDKESELKQIDVETIGVQVEQKQTTYKAAAGFGSKENHESADHSQRQHFAGKTDSDIFS